MTEVNRNSVSGLPAPPGLVVELASGIRLLLRPIAADDKAKLRLGMGGLSAGARRQRFFSARGELDDNLVGYLTEIDYRHHFAWVAVDLDRPGQPIVAVGRYIAADDHGVDSGSDSGSGPVAPLTAEIAFVVGDDYQRQGIATMLLDLLTIVAQANGIEEFSARVLGDNVAMRHILTRAGAKLRQDEAGVLAATLDVPAPSKRFSPVAVRAIAGAAADGAQRRIA